MKRPNKETHTNGKRELVRHVLKFALKDQLVKQAFVFGDQAVEELAWMIEMAIFIFSNEDIANPMYMTKCYDLDTNIRNTENTDFFRKIINGTIIAKDLVAMSSLDFIMLEIPEPVDPIDPNPEVW